MSLLEHQTEPEPVDDGSHVGRYVLIALLVVGCGGAAYLSMPPAEEPAAPRQASAPAAAAAPEPAPATAPEEAAPAPEPAPEPEPEPEAVIAEVEVPTAALPPVLRVVSDVAGASVYVARKYLGTTPFETADLRPGPHRGNVSAEGYEGFVETVEIGDEVVSLDIRFREIRLDVSVAVTHKHRFGDCEGTLRADLDGIRYDTDDDDAFSLSFDAIEIHEFDYLEHTLTIKERDGRTYNFTDDQDTADALFSFHRDVEQARERMNR